MFTRPNPAVSSKKVTPCRSHRADAPTSYLYRVRMSAKEYSLNTPFYASRRVLAPTRMTLLRRRNAKSVFSVQSPVSQRTTVKPTLPNYFDACLG